MQKIGFVAIAACADDMFFMDSSSVGIASALRMLAGKRGKSPVDAKSAGSEPEEVFELQRRHGGIFWSGTATFNVAGELVWTYSNLNLWWSSRWEINFLTAKIKTTVQKDGKKWLQLILPGSVEQTYKSFIGAARTGRKLRFGTFNEEEFSKFGVKLAQRRSEVIKKEVNAKKKKSKDECRIKELIIMPNVKALSWEYKFTLRGPDRTALNDFKEALRHATNIEFLKTEISAKNSYNAGSMDKPAVKVGDHLFEMPFKLRVVHDFSMDEFVRNMGTEWDPAEAWK